MSIFLLLEYFRKSVSLMNLEIIQRKLRINVKNESSFIHLILGAYQIAYIFDLPIFSIVNNDSSLGR